MARITLHVLDGADRGRVFEDLATPVTIGREEGNTVQLNDERVSRFHLKIQEDQDKIVLTDLDSTNGTKVNGEEVQLRILRYGDLISLGRSVLLFGSRDEIASRLAALRREEGSGGTRAPSDPAGDASKVQSLDFELSWTGNPEVYAALHTLQPPELPKGLSAGQAAQLSELIEYLHIRLRQLIASAVVNERDETVYLEYRRWQALLDLQWRLAHYLRSISNPDQLDE